MKSNKWLFIAILFSLSLACTISSIPNAGTTPDNSASSQPGSATTESILPSPTPIPSIPVSIRKGLASLNSYTLKIDSNSTGPTPMDFSQISYEIKHSNDLDASSTYSKNVQSSEGDSQPSTTETYSYSIGNASCSGSDEDGWDYSEITAQESEMQDLLSQMVDAIPLIDNPTYIGNEMLNGIMTNHFSFQVSGLGLESGSQVNANQGEYWLAQDGQYVVRYSLVTETMDSSTGTILHLDFLINVTDINQPVDISFPSGCHL